MPASGARPSVALAWVGGVALGYYLLCALGLSLYRLLAWAF